MRGQVRVGAEMPSRSISSGAQVLHLPGVLSYSPGINEGDRAHTNFSVSFLLPQFTHLSNGNNTSLYSLSEAAVTP